MERAVYYPHGGLELGKVIVMQSKEAALAS